jgi:ADP-heptose:LPS heptosyltransferase
MRKILIVKIGAIGDIIMALPVICEIRKQYPDAHITWVCGNVVANLLREVPGIDTVVNVDEGKIFAKNKLVALREILAFQLKMAFTKFDIVLSYHPDARYKIFSSLVKSPRKLRLRRDGDRPTLIPARSRSFEHVRLFLQHDDNYTGDISFPQDSINEANLSAIKVLFDYAARPFVILAPGGAKNSLSEQELRRWPIENYVEVAKYLQSKGIQVVVTGIKSDEWVLSSFAGVDIINMVGKLSIVELIALMKQSKMVLTHDSGPYHLAVFAQQCHVIGLFGPTNPAEFTYGKKFDKINILWEGPNIFCSPCYFGKFFSTQCKNNICMQMITPEQVIERVDSLL